MSRQVCPGVSSRASVACSISPSVINRQSYDHTASEVSEVQPPKPACRPRAFSSSVSPPLWFSSVCRDTQESNHGVDGLARRRTVTVAISSCEYVNKNKISPVPSFFQCPQSQVYLDITNNPSKFFHHQVATPF